MMVAPASDERRAEARIGQMAPPCSLETVPRVEDPCYGSEAGCNDTRRADILVTLR